MEVSRAIDLIDDKMCWGRGTFSVHHMPEYDEYWQAGEMAIEALKKQERDKWVPCSKRKPDIDSEVFITDSFGEIGHAYYVNLGDRVCFVTAEEYIILEDVKAWKLVPEPYEEGKK